jgi:hypothetical protein
MLQCQQECQKHNRCFYCNEFIYGETKKTHVERTIYYYHPCCWKKMRLLLLLNPSIFI